MWVRFLPGGQMAKVIPASFLARDARRVARDLLGKNLCQRANGKIRRFKILETEAYLGEQDLASHARSGRDGRAAPMFGPAGYWYVYLVYGMHEMLNIVTGQVGQAGAVLIRRVEGLSGPSKLTNALKITRALNNQPAAPKTGLWLEYNNKISARGRYALGVKATPRVGVAYAGAWANKPYRFILEA